MTHKFRLLHGGIAVLVLAAAIVPSIAASPGPVVYVADVEQLYDAVNAVNDVNVGATVVLAPGIYTLSVNDQFGAARPHGGRLELKQDMSLYGVAGDRAAVVIDAKGLLSPSFTAELPMGQRTGVIRIGRGSNAIEWLTVLAKPVAAAGIETDLGETSSTWIRVAHVVSDGSSRGVDVRNAGWAMNVGRQIDAEIVDNEFVGPPPTDVSSSVTTEGIRVSNFAGADSGVIVATLSRNRSHGFQYGCVIANNRSSNAIVQVRSSVDRFFGNAQACVIFGGISQTATGIANSNSTAFEAHGSEFVDNTLTIDVVKPGGIRVAGGLSTIKANATSQNIVSVALWGSKVSGNSGDFQACISGIDFQAYGACSGTTNTAGHDNHATIELHGVSALVDYVAADSVPDDPSAGNSVTVIRSPDRP
ncbi:MAG TPA: hypothetical protein VFU28_20330 [Vicinamibacterales bacterium]|nr:hypothetical protein [Vicinamibacterales bacterium]